MKTWFVTTVSPDNNGKYDVGLANKLNYLESQSHVIVSIVNVSGGISIVCYTE